MAKDRSLGLSGACRGKAFTVTTVGDDRLDRPADFVSRQFRAPAPNRLWVADLTYVKTHAGWVYVAFIVDVFSRRVVGWQASQSLRSDLAIDALEMAVWNRQRTGGDLAGLTHHSDRGVQGSISASGTPNAWPRTRSSARSVPRATATTALAESFNGLYKWELIYRQGALAGPRRRRVGAGALYRTGSRFRLQSTAFG